MTIAKTELIIKFIDFIFFSIFTQLKPYIYTLLISLLHLISFVVLSNRLYMSFIYFVFPFRI